jgi:sigma-B regulation protein RsbU (phosphoserine phosphatase)
MFGKDRLKAVIRENYNQTSAGILHAVANAVKDFRGEEPQLDDITIVVLKAE